jgi:glyoxylase-like metal-dependent hydrolase (beta-lactamase superfamily II)
MKQVADDVHVISWSPLRLFNVFLVGDVLVDAGVRQSAWWILRELRGRPLRALALTHVHPDHAGGVTRLCGELGVPVWCGAADAGALEDGRSNYVPERPFHRFVGRVLGRAGHRVARRLREGDELAAGFTVLETPGHSPGHLSLWRESDRALLIGEVLLNIGLRPTEPLKLFTADPELNRRSARRLLELEPRLVCFSHGRVLRNGRKLSRYG